MGYMIATGSCVFCRKIFSFNPTKVPSYNGSPICQDCMNKINAKRQEAGYPALPIQPGAYDPEPIGNENNDDEFEMHETTIRTEEEAQAALASGQYTQR